MRRIAKAAIAAIMMITTTTIAMIHSVDKPAAGAGVGLGDIVGVGDAVTVGGGLGVTTIGAKTAEYA